MAICECPHDAKRTQERKDTGKAANRENTPGAADTQDAARTANRQNATRAANRENAPGTANTQDAARAADAPVLSRHTYKTP
jgi:hypothetical protein